MKAASNSNRAGADSWRPLYRAGALAAGCAVACYAAALVMVVVTATPPTSGGTAILEYVDAHRTTYVIRQLLWLTPSLFLMVLVLALAVAMRRNSRSLAAAAGLIAVVSWAVSFAWPTTGDGSLAMVVLSDRYASSAPADRAPYVAGAEMLSALNDVPAIIGVLQTSGILLIALLMLRGVFTRALGWLGVATGAVGIAAESLRPVLGWAYAVYGLLLLVWVAWTGLALRRIQETETAPNARSSRFPAGETWD